MIRRTVLNLEPLQLEWRRYGVVTSVCLGLGALICTTGWPALAPFGWGLLGVATGLPAGSRRGSVARAASLVAEAPLAPSAALKRLDDRRAAEAPPPAS